MGFRKGEFRVQFDNSTRKLTVKGRRSLGDGRFMHLEQVFAVPEDSQADKISGRFEGGCLSLFMPKKEVRDEKISAKPQQVPQGAVSSEKPRSEELMQKEKQVAGDKKEEAPTEKARPISSARKEEEPMQKEKAKDRAETQAAVPAETQEKTKDKAETQSAAPVNEEKPLADEKVSSEPKGVPQRTVSFEKLRSKEPIQKEKPVAGDKKEEAPIQKDQPASSARTEEEPIQKERAGGEETKAAAPVYEEKPLTDEKKEEHLIQDEPIRKKKPMSSTVSDDRFEKYKKKGLAWKETIEEEVGRWLDCESIDRLLETISNNKKVIAAAVAAFSLGFYVSRKLRSSGR